METETTPRTAPLDPVMVRVLAGDPDAERELCRRVLPALRAFAARRLRGSSVDDFVHDALLLLVEGLRERRLQDPTQVGAFALGICRNLARERARNDERRRELLEAYGPTLSELVTGESAWPIRRAALEDCLSQLTERARQVIRSTFCHDDDDQEIATALSLSGANVRVIRHRSLAALRECLEKPISWVQT